MLCFLIKVLLNKKPVIQNSKARNSKPMEQGKMKMSKITTKRTEKLQPEKGASVKEENEMELPSTGRSSRSKLKYRSTDRA